MYTLRPRRIMLRQLSDIRNCSGNQEWSILRLLMVEDNALRLVVMVVQSNGSLLPAVNICSLFESVASTLHSIKKRVLHY